MPVSLATLNSDSAGGNEVIVGKAIAYRVVSAISIAGGSSDTNGGAGNGRPRIFGWECHQRLWEC